MVAWPPAARQEHSETTLGRTVPGSAFVFRGPGNYTSRMRLLINGEPFTAAHDGWAVADLLAHLDLEPGKVAVELNRDIVPKTGYAEQRLRDGDELEILHFVGGGRT